MNRSNEDSNYSDLKQEIAALRKRVGELESGGRAKRRLSRNPAFGVFLFAVGAILTLGVLGAQSTATDALFVNQKGNVGIGTRTPGSPLSFADKTGDKISLFGQGAGYYGLGIQSHLLQIYSDRADSNIAFGYGNSGAFTQKMVIKGSGDVGIGTDPTETLDVNGTLKVSGTSRLNGWVGINTPPIANQNLVITPTSGDRPLNVTDPGGGVNWLSVMPNGGVIMNGGAVVLGGTEAKSRLDVKGEIRGKPWLSQEFEWKKGDTMDTRMTRADRTVCFLTLITGDFNGDGELAQIVQSGDYWMLHGLAKAAAIKIRARCIGAPDDSW